MASRIPFGAPWPVASRYPAISWRPSWDACSTSTSATERQSSASARCDNWSRATSSSWLRPRAQRSFKDLASGDSDGPFVRSAREYPASFGGRALALAPVEMEAESDDPLSPARSRPALETSSRTSAATVRIDPVITGREYFMGQKSRQAATLGGMCWIREECPSTQGPVVTTVSIEVMVVIGATVLVTTRR